MELIPTLFVTSGHSMNCHKKLNVFGVRKIGQLHQNMLKNDDIIKLYYCNVKLINMVYCKIVKTMQT